MSLFGFKVELDYSSMLYILDNSVYSNDESKRYLKKIYYKDGYMPPRDEENVINYEKELENKLKKRYIEDEKNINDDNIDHIEFVELPNEFPQLQYSTNGSSWYDVTIPFEYEFSGSSGTKYLYFRAKNTNTSLAGIQFWFYADGYSNLGLVGNIQYLLDSTGNSNQVYPNCFCQLFKLKYMPKLLSLPELPATELAKSCYENMFECNSNGVGDKTFGTVLPTLTHVTKLADHCCDFMYYLNGYAANYSNIQNYFPRATDLKPYCYSYMFGYYLIFITNSSTVNLYIPTFEQGAEAALRGLYGNMDLTSNVTTVNITLPNVKAEEKMYNAFISAFCIDGFYESKLNVRNINITIQHPETSYASFNQFMGQCIYNVTGTKNIVINLPNNFILSEQCFIRFYRVGSDDKGNVVNVTINNFPENGIIPKQCFYSFMNTKAVLKNDLIIKQRKWEEDSFTSAFKGCTNFNKIKVYITEWPENATTEWLDGVSPTGTFICPPSLPQIRDGSHIPEGWTIDTSSFKEIYYQVPSGIKAPAPLAFEGASYTLLLDDIPVMDDTESLYFRGWFKDEDHMQPVVEGETITDNITFYSKWDPKPQYAVKYFTEHGTAPDRLTVYEGHELTEEELAPLDDEMPYHFDGWYTDPTYENKCEPGYEVLSNVNLYAHWIHMQFNLTYHTDHGTAPDQKTVDIGYLLEDADLPNLPSVDTYNFLGWFNESLETRFHRGMEIVENKNLYAKWTENDVVNITYHSVAELDLYNHREESGYLLQDYDIPDLDLEDYTFGGWYKDSEYTEEAHVGDEVTEDIDLYAKLIPKSNIVYVSAHGNPPPNKKVDNPYTLTQEDLPELEEYGYRFDGWFYVPDEE